MGNITSYFIFFIFIISFISSFEKSTSFTDRKFFHLAWFLIAILYSYLLRTNHLLVLDSDMLAYTRLMQGITYSGSANEIDFTQLRFLKEPIVWGMLKYLFVFLQNVKLTFITIDMINFIIIYCAIKQYERYLIINYNLNNNLNYLYFFYLIFFSTLQGLLLVYRQFMAINLLMLSLGLFINQKDLKGSLVFLFAIMSHNSIGFFLPIIFIFKNNFFRKFLILIAIIIMPFLYEIISDNRLSIHIGNNIKIFYLSITIILFFISFVIFKLNPGEKINSIFATFFFIISFQFLIFSFVMPDSQFQRIFFLSSSIFLVFFCLLNEVNLKNKIIGRILILSTSMAFGLIHVPIMLDFA